MTTILRFGKYRSREIADIYETDPQYCRWLLHQDILTEGYPDIRLFLDGKFKDDDKSFLMTWGRYKNKTIQFIKDNDVDYFNWLLNNTFVKSNCGKLLQELLKINESSETNTETNTKPAV